MPPTPRSTKPTLDLVALELLEALGERFERTLDVGLDDEVERRRLAGLDLVEDVLEADTLHVDRCVPATCGHTLPVLAGLGHRSGLALVGGDHEVVTGEGHVGETEHLRPASTAGFLDLLALVVDERPDTAPRAGRPPAGHRHAACRAARGSLRPDHGRCRGWPRGRRHGRDRRGWLGGPRARRPPGGSRAARRCRCPAAPRSRTSIVSPPQASGTSPCSESCCMTRSGSAFSRSILLIATTIGTSAALAWSMASTVWGMTPSSAATTRTTMSVASAPRARMAVNASWPGVSMKVMPSAVLLDLVGTDVLGDATGLARDDVGVADAVEQLGLAVVDVAHDGDDRCTVRPGLVLVVFVLGDVEHLAELDLLLLARVDERISAPTSAANSSIMSSDSDCVAVTISPCCIRKRTTSAAVRFRRGPRSCGVEPRSMTITPSGTGALAGV